MGVIEEPLVVLHGLGVEGRAARTYLAAHEDADVLVVDEAGRDAAEAALRPGVLYLRSPGIAPSDPLHAAAIARGATVRTPTGLWLERLAPDGTVTVTGTKGKSTTTAMLAALLGSSAYGNIGRPPLDGELPKDEAPVVELSSYMGSDLAAPRSRRWRHVVTNLYREHTDWHGGEAPYREAKLRPFRFDPPCPGVAPRALVESEGLRGVEAIEDRVGLDGSVLSVDVDELDLASCGDAFGSPATVLAMRAALAGALPCLSDPLDRAELVAGRWTGLPSRQAIVPSTDGRVWVDDALATVPEATEQALVRFGGRSVRLVLGGKDRGQDYARLAARIASLPDTKAYGFGEVGAKLGALGIALFGGMEEAVTAAASDCPPGGVVLFSPAAPSGAPHASYVERAAIFAQLARDG